MKMQQCHYLLILIELTCLKYVYTLLQRRLYFKVTFKNKHLEELYSTGQSRKYKKVPVNVVRKLPRAVNVLEQITVIQDLWSYPGYNFENLQGSNQYSMRLSLTWRLIMEIDWTNPEELLELLD